MPAGEKPTRSKLTWGPWKGSGMAEAWYSKVRVLGRLKRRGLFARFRRLLEDVLHKNSRVNQQRGGQRIDPAKKNIDHGPCPREAHILVENSDRPGSGDSFFSCGVYFPQLASKHKAEVKSIGHRLHGKHAWYKSR